MSKENLRKQYQDKRKNLDPNFMKKSEDLFYVQWKKLKIRKIKKIALYWPIKNEASPLKIIEDLKENELQVYLPCLDESKKVQCLIFREFVSEKMMQLNRYGILEPTDSSPIKTEALDLIVIPCVCFDLKGYRIGMGKGFYDFTLQNNKERPLLLTLAYEFQMIKDALPKKHDVATDAVLTERNLYKISDYSKKAL